MSPLISNSGHDNLRDLVWLRSLSIVAQSLVIVTVVYGLGLDLPLLPLVGLIALQAGWNIYSWLRLRRPHPLSEREYFIQLLADVMVITGLLYFTGGAANPFSWVYLVPLVLATTLLPRKAAWLMAAITIACYSALMLWHVPLPGAYQMAHNHGFNQHIFGMWLGFVLSAMVVVHFVADIAHNLRQRDRQLAAAKEQALKDERLIALGTLAAGAAHELGTPLGSMAIVTADLLLDHPASADADLHRQLTIIDEQIRRCKDALSVISASSGTMQMDAGGRVPIAAYLRELAEHWQAGRSAVVLSLEIDDQAPPLEMLVDQTLTQALHSILNNAADASPGDVTLIAGWSRDALHLRVLDRGQGLSPTVSERIGEVQVSTKEQGLGLGLFLAHAAIGRLGGQVWLRPRDGGGTCTEIELPLPDMSP